MIPFVWPRNYESRFAPSFKQRENYSHDKSTKETAFPGGRSSQKFRKVIGVFAEGGNVDAEAEFEEAVLKEPAWGRF